MWFYFRLFLLGLRLVGRERRDLVLENLVLRQQLAVLTRPRPRVSLRANDRRFWSTVARSWFGWRKLHRTSGHAAIDVVEAAQHGFRDDGNPLFCSIHFLDSHVDGPWRSRADVDGRDVRSPIWAGLSLSDRAGPYDCRDWEPARGGFRMPVALGQLHDVLIVLGQAST